MNINLNDKRSWRNATANLLRLTKRAYKVRELASVEHRQSAKTFGICLLLAGLMLLFVGVAHAQTIQGIDIDRLANAIYISEGGSHTNHPYGILIKYKNTTARIACINTIKHKLHDFKREVETILDEREFIAYLGKTYCPVGASNDPSGLNVNWVGNVIELYEKL